MKAVIMAGGQGARLRPLSIKRPKPMVPLLGEPLLSHSLKLLKKNGVSEAVLTLKYLPESIVEHFSDYKAIKLHFRVEETPMGTAGCVKACSDLLSGGEFLAVSGDAVCDFDLKAALKYHRRKKALATIVLRSSPEPLEYGLVRLGSGGLIEAFTEKPSWSRVYTDLVNTGVYILSPEILEDIPEGVPFDFAKDLFPLLLRRGEPLFGFETEGYWCDVGNCAAYLRCNMDALAGKISSLGPAVEAVLPEGVFINEPVFIDDSVTVEPGATIGPFSIITNGSYIKCGARIKNSVVYGSSVHEDAELLGATVINAVIGARAALRPGSVVADGSSVGGGATIQEGVRVWPDQELPPGILLGADLTENLPAKPPEFEDGIIRDGADLPFLIKLGAASSVFENIGVAWSSGADIFAQAFACGARGAGANITELDAEFASAAAFAAALYGLPLTVFFDLGFEPALRLFDSKGLPIQREMERKLISALNEGAPSDLHGSEKQLGGVMEAYIATAARSKLSHSDMPVAVGMGGAGNRALKKTLKSIGCRLLEPGPGILCLAVSDGGFSLRAKDERGQSVSSPRIFTLLTSLELGAKGLAAVPDTAPSALDALALKLGARLLRPARDGEEAEQLYVDSPFMRDGIFAAARLVSHLALNKKTLEEALEGLPEFSRVLREIPLRRGRAEVMRDLTKSCAEAGIELSHGLKISTRLGSARVMPTADKCALRLEVEGGNMEAAEELFEGLSRRIKAIDEKK